MNNRGEWEKVCKKFCEMIEAKLLFVNDSDFGFETKHGKLVHWDCHELESFINNKKAKGEEIKL